MGSRTLRLFWGWRPQQLFAWAVLSRARLSSAVCLTVQCAPIPAARSVSKSTGLCIVVFLLVLKAFGANFGAGWFGGRREWAAGVLSCMHCPHPLTHFGLKVGGGAQHGSALGAQSREEGGSDHPVSAAVVLLPRCLACLNTVARPQFCMGAGVATAKCIVIETPRQTPPLHEHR